MDQAGRPQELARAFRAHPSSLFGVRTFLRERAAADGFGPALTDDLVLAVSEASANAVLHSGSPMFRVSWHREDQARYGTSRLHSGSELDEVHRFGHTCADHEHHGRTGRSYRCAALRTLATSPRLSRCIAPVS